MGVQGPVSVTTTTRRQVSVRRLHARIVLLPALGVLLLGLLIYQLPARIAVPVGSLGDQLFLDSSEALDTLPEATGQWYSDELDAAGRSRWTRSRARLDFPSLGGGAVDVSIRVQGWPADVLRTDIHQPLVTARIVEPDGSRSEAGTFEPTPEWQEYDLSIPASARSSGSLQLELETSAVFTSTRQFADVRPKGIRVDHITLATASPATPLMAGWPTLLVLAGAVLILTIALQRLKASITVAVGGGSGLALIGLIALAVWRPWAAALMPLTFLPALVAALPIVWPRVKMIARSAGQRLRAGSIPAIGVMAALVGIAVLLLAETWPGVASVIGILGDRDQLIQTLPLLLGGLLLVVSPTIIPGILRHLRRWLVAGWLAPVLLALIAGILLGWEFYLLRILPFAGHADYADNAVVARSLLRGQGWQVPYVTQFYELVPGGTVYRPQETWPLLQPVWMAPFMTLLGPTAFAARLPNLIFNLALLLLVYHVGSRIWDRRTGLLAALFTLFNHFFFLLAIFSTTDLGFVVFSMAAIWLFFHAATIRQDGSATRTWLTAGLVTGLMGLQKPTGAIFAAGMLAWIVLRRWRGDPLPWRGLLAWAMMAGIVVLPYLIRNLLLFGHLHYSTESLDAWILGFQGSRDAWEDIYSIHLGDLPNRSWILRWGWDHSIDKVLTQVHEVRLYLLPPDANLLGIAVTWLALAGLVTARGRQRSLLGLVALIGALYTTFLVTYWHANEERYFLPFVPWLMLAAMGALNRAFDAALHYRGGRLAGLAALLGSLLLVNTLQAERRPVDAFLDPAQSRYWGRQWLPDLEAYEWLRQHTTADAVIMTRVPWQLSFTADRPSLMIPNAPLVSDEPCVATIMQAARYYGADYLVVNAMTGPRGPAAETLRPLSLGEPILGFTPIFTGTSQFGRRPIRIYRFPTDYAGAAPLSPDPGACHAITARPAPLASSALPDGARP